MDENKELKVDSNLSPTLTPANPSAAANLDEAENEQGGNESVDVEKGIIDEQPRVKYSRYEKMRQRALEAEAEANSWRERAENSNRYGRSRFQEDYKNDYSEEVPSEWRDLLGDTPEARRVWELERQREQRLLETFNKTLEEREQMEYQRISRNEAYLDDTIEELSDELGRDLTTSEESALLDIIDEYTPTGPDGKYLGEILPVEKAWEIYEMRRELSGLSTKEAKNRVASISGTQSHGEPSIDADQAERDRAFNPLNPGSWRNNPLAKKLR